MGFTLENLKDRLTSPFNTEEDLGGEAFPATFPVTLGEKNPTHLLLQVFQEGYWQRIIDNITILRRETVRENKTGQVLDNYAKYLNMQREEDETDAKFRIRIKGEERVRFGGTSFEEIHDFVVRLIQGNDADVKLFENIDNNDAYKDAFLRVELNADRLIDLGFPSDDLTPAKNDIEDLVSRTSAGGINVEVIILSGADYDTAKYDTAGDLYGV